MTKSLAFLVISFIFIATSHKISCNDNLFVSEQKNVYYIESEQKFTWYDSLAKCASMNMSLVTIDSKNKSLDITNLLSNIFGRRIPLWIGGCITGVNPRQFVWIPTGKRFTYMNWAPGQPDFAGLNEYCAQIGWTDTMQWNDHVCSNQFGFICEYSRLHECQEKLQLKLQDEAEKQQQAALKQMVGEIVRNQTNVDNGNRTFSGLVFNINQYVG